MLREEVVFGPIKSRRLGWSLGINLLPTKGKICNFDCIYCECGWNADGRDDTKLPSAAEVRSALEAKLADILLEGTQVDSITFSGDGEPTLNPDFARIIDDTIALRDIYCPQAKVSVLTNATKLLSDTVFGALRKVDAPILKLDAPTDERARKINGALPSFRVDDVVKGMKRFEGDFILQTMFLKSDDFDSLEPQMLAKWMDIVREIRPRLIMAYTIARPTPQSGLSAYSAAQIREALKPLEDEGFKIQINA
ncbi:MAG: radical SAM protein [Bacteroidales bacterium]|mgnify:FL=1|nr:radical SAM protein [Bacteroidales bacterium]MDD7608654.1 radical SAM protein [Bacteroidales bacterium]